MNAEKIRDAFRNQANACRELGSPLTAEICEILTDALEVGQGAVADRVLGWPNDPRGDALALRLCGGLHMLVLKGSDRALADAYANNSPTAELLLNAIAAHNDFLLEWLKSPPQTNEVGRSAAIIAAARFISGYHPLPISALELGASAGLNLNFHRYHLMPQADLQSSQVALFPKWNGEVPEAQINVAKAEGVDLKPADPVRDELRLLAYCWPDQADRMTRLKAALKLAQEYPPKVTAGDAAGWLQERLGNTAPNHLTLVYHTVAWQYFPPQTQATCEAALQEAGGKATTNAPLAHFSMEADGGNGAAMTLRLWDGRLRCWNLGRADFHGRWIDWQPKQV